jgi:hypothetical protein
MIIAVTTRNALIVAFVTLLVGACKSDPPPKPDAPTVDASNIDAPADLCAGGTVAYLGTCTGAAECGSCVCQSFGHTSRCTIACTAGGDPCPAPSGGCGTNGFCRP